MFRYAQIDENGYIVSDSYLSGEVTAENMIAIEEGFETSNKRYVDGEWVEYTPDPEPANEPEPTEAELIQAELLLNQVGMLNRQTEMDETLAAILLNQIGV